MDSATREMQMQLALSDISDQLKPNYAATARKNEGVQRTTLQRRFEGSQSSRAEANAEHRQRLLIEQEEAIISHINKLTDRSLPPTSQIVCNLAEEIIGGPERKN
jgi:flagellar motor protein MotB